MKCYQPKRLFKYTLILFKFSFIAFFSPATFFFMPLTFLAGVGLLISAILFLTIGGLDKVYVHPFEDSKEYKECLFGQMFNLEEKLEKEKKNRDFYYKQQRESWKSSAIGVFLFFLGLFIESMSVLLVRFFPLFVLGVVPGLYIQYMCYDWIWEGFINSSNPRARKAADLLAIRSPAVKAEQSAKMIAVLTKRIREMEQKELQKQEELQEREDSFLQEESLQEELSVAETEKIENDEKKTYEDDTDNQQLTAQERLQALIDSGHREELWTQEKVWAQEAKRAQAEKQKRMEEQDFFGLWQDSEKKVNRGG